MPDWGGRGDRTMSCRSGPSSGTMFRMGLASLMIRMVMSSIVFKSAEVPPPVWLRCRSLFLTLS